MPLIKDFVHNNLRGTAIWLVTFLLAPVPGILMKDKKSIIIGAAIALTILVWTGAFLLIKSIQTGKKEQSIKHKELTLEYFFKNDFKLMGFRQEATFIDKEFVFKFKTKEWHDFEARSRFISIYIPTTSRTFDILAKIPDIYQQFTTKGKVEIETGSPTLQPVNAAELKFSGRIFLYHESPLFEYQKRDLYKIYEKQGLAPQFRGPDYLFKKKEIEEEKNH